jgi:hypothetical protein
VTSDHPAFCGAANYNGPFYSASGTQLGTWTGGFPRITSTDVLQQVIPDCSPSNQAGSCNSSLDTQISKKASQTRKDLMQHRKSHRCKEKLKGFQQ